MTNLKVKGYILVLSKRFPLRGPCSEEILKEKGIQLLYICSEKILKEKGMYHQNVSRCAGPEVKKSCKKRVYNYYISLKRFPAPE